MPNLTITIETGNAAFEDDVEAEVTRVLRALCDKVEGSGLETGQLRDLNGNRVGNIIYAVPNKDPECCSCGNSVIRASLCWVCKNPVCPHCARDASGGHYVCPDCEDL